MTKDEYCNGRKHVWRQASKHCYPNSEGVERISYAMPPLMRLALILLNRKDLTAGAKMW